ncbi:hypothetical protein CCAX7_59900 [Capsulimonas corticalis]|uniref:Uncharacterized protein n=1 Tax=Capsulimonas corticalis TaxID=2219043 RepID=A0A402CZP3_9BACT|nr:hypothetical protein [Capsulimonas corticalis]BDI33939.1 hypothetical protein CCAX7_59900 [Capsulimonas corticalis]
MDLIFHAPYIFRGILTVLVPLLALAIHRAARRRDRQSTAAAILAAGIALGAGGGFALTALAPMLMQRILPWDWPLVLQRQD